MSMSLLDPGQVIKEVYDSTNSALQVNVVAQTAPSNTVKIIDGVGGVNEAQVSAANALKVDGSAVTQPVSAASLPLPTGASTSAAQTTGNASLATIESAIGTDAGAVPAKRMLVAGMNSAGTTAYTVQVDSQGHLKTDVITSALPTGAATEATLSTLNSTVSARLTGSLVPAAFDYISLGYTGSNVTTVTYKTGGSGGTTVATLTLGYDGSNNLTSVTKT